MNYGRTRNSRSAELPPAVSRPLFLSVAVVVALTGCRTYGGYDSTEKIVAAIGTTNDAFARSLERARAETEAFQRAATANPVLEPYAVRYGEIVAEHERIVELHGRELDELGGWPFEYSAASRLLGAIVSEQSIVTDGYQEVARGAASALGLQLANQPRPIDNYVQVPPYFERIRFEVVKADLDAVLRAARGS